MIVWVWESGYYSDYSVHGLYDSAETAKFAAECSLRGWQRLTPLPRWERKGEEWQLGEDNYSADRVRPMAVETRADLAPTCRMPLLARIITTAGQSRHTTAAECALPLDHPGPHDWEGQEAAIFAKLRAYWRGAELVERDPVAAQAADASDT